jgi:hypothetical protein
MPRVDLPRRTYIPPGRGDSAPPLAVQPEQPRPRRGKKPAKPAEEQPNGPDRN